MCYRVNCKQCGKHSWGGCGKHLATVFANIEQGMHCMCRSWPGVVIPPARRPTDADQKLPSAEGTNSSGTATADKLES